MSEQCRRQLALRATVIAISLLSGLAVAELVALVTYGPGFLSIVDPYEHHPYRPYAELTDTAGNRIVTNSLGWKDSQPGHEIARNPSPRRRVVMLGDSFTEGLGVNEEQTFSAFAERRLNRGGERYEVLNGGRVSYSPLLEYMRLKRFLDQGYRTDVVVLLPDLSDVQDELEYAPEYVFSAAGEPLRLRSGSYSSAVRWIYNRSALARWIRRFQLRLTGRLPSLAETAHSGPDVVVQPADVAVLRNGEPLPTALYRTLPDVTKSVLRHTWIDHPPSLAGWAGEGLAAVDQGIVRIRELTRRHGIRLIVVVYPNPLALYTREDPAYYRVLRRTFPRWYRERELVFGSSVSNGAVAYREAIAGTCRAQSIPFVDLFPLFSNTTGWHRLFLPGDVHFDAAGHRLVAEAIAGAISRAEPTLPGGGP